LYKLLPKALSILTAGERKQLYWLTAFQGIICIVDLSALALLVLAVGSLYPSSRFFQNINVTPATFFVFLLIIFLMKNYFAFAVQQYQFRMVYRIAARLSKQGLDQFLNGPFDNYTEVDSSVWVRRISQQPVEFAQYILTGYQTIFTELLLVSGATILLLLYNAPLFLLILSVLLPALLVVLHLTRKRLQHVRASIKTNSERNLQYLQESLQGYVESNLFGKHDFFTNRYGNQQQQLNHHLAQLQSTSLLPSRLMETFAVAGFCLLAIFQFSVITPSSIPILTLGAFLAGAYKLIPGIVRIINARNSIKTFAFAIQDLAITPIRKEESVNNIHLRTITFQQVSFQIAGKSILKNVNIRLEAGMLTGMTAPSGKGKTTLINLLLGFREISSGKIFFNDAEVAANERKLYWNRISYVKQVPFVLHDSLAQNITLENSHTGERIEAVTRITQIQNWLESDAATTAITEGGKNISGGQQQRIALARALHKDADCYILDEPFHALDAKATDHLINQLEELAATGKIVLVISHDLLTIQRCSQIFTLT
jgi:ABC-type multidrug transport system fused ATPase/permease subunit